MERSATDGRSIVGPATAPIWIQSSVRLRSERAVSWTTSSAPARISSRSRPRSRPADHASGAESLGYLHRHGSGVADRAEDEDALPRCGGTRRRSATQEDIAGFVAAATLATSTANLGYQEVHRCGCRLFIRAGQSL